MLPWLRSMPPPSGIAKIGTRPGVMAEINAVGTHQFPKAVAIPVVIERETENRTPPRRDAQPRGSLSNTPVDRTMRTCLAPHNYILYQASSVALDLETAKIDEQTATIDRIASVRKAKSFAF